jgi:hypothetical protein
MTLVGDSKLESLYAPLRYEDGAWSLLRVDKGLRYGLKSLLHRTRPATRADADYYANSARYLRERSRQHAGHTHRRLRFGSVGDLMWLPGQWDAALSPQLRSKLRDFDLRFANLETPVDDTKPVPRLTYALFNAPPHYLDPWLEAKTSVLSLCNNHVLDQGLEGLSRTRSLIERSGTALAVGGPQPGDAVRVFEHGGLTIAAVGTTYGINPWGHGLRPEQYPAGIPRHAFGNPRQPTDWRAVEALLDDAKAAKPDLVVFMPHWGFEFEYYPEAPQRRDAHRLVAMGVDVILGSSPHVVQPIEVVSVNGWDERCPVQLERPGAPRPAVIAYSQGNFTSSMPSLACNVGLVLDVTLSFATSGAMQLDRLAWFATLSKRRGLIRPGRTTHDLLGLDVGSVGPHARHFARILGRP